MAIFNKKPKKQETINIETSNIVEHAKDWKISDGQLVVDVYETEKELVIQSAIAGVKNNKINIGLENDILIITGERENPIKDEEKTYFTKECYFGPFSREIILPREIDTSRIEAKIKEGVLTIRMPKIERAKNKKIEVED